MRPLLVTGANGFIGQHLVRCLSKLDAPVIGLGHGLMVPSKQKEIGLHHWLNGDVDHANLQDLCNRFGTFDSIFHLAGGSHVGRSFENPSEDFQRTVVTGSSLFEWARLNCPEARIVVASSAAVYGAETKGPIREDATLQPYSPYGANKAILEALALSYCTNFQMKITVCRLFSVYGRGLRKQLLFELCHKCMRAGVKEIMLGGSGEELRDWINVEDAARLLALARETCSPDCVTVNGGTGIATPVRAIAKLLVDCWDPQINIEFSGKARKGDPFSLVADTTKAVELGFSHQISPADGIKDVVKWFREAYEQ